MKKTFGITAILLILVCLLTACDPVLPADTIRVELTPNPLPKGTSAEINIYYPPTDDTAIADWVNPRVEILEGDEIIAVSGLEVTALDPGRALLLVEVDADCTFLGIVIDRVTYSAELEVNVSEPLSA